MDAPIEVVVKAQQMYGRQLQAIDEGDAEEWATTFTYDGEFHSPSYERPSRGRDELVAFGAAFRSQAVRRGQVLRHILTNLHVVTTADPQRYRATAYLSIVATEADGARTVRVTMVRDDVVHVGGALRVACRRVAPDQAPPTHT